MKNISLIKWAKKDGIASSIQIELIKLGYITTCFTSEQLIPTDSNIVLSFGPYGRIQGVIKQISQMPAGDRPIFVHWNFESIPNPSVPSQLLKVISNMRSGVDSMNDYQNMVFNRLLHLPPLSWVNSRMYKFRYLGDYLKLHKNGLLTVLADISVLQTRTYRRFGIPASHIPWGTPKKWYATLDLARDIDVLWIGSRRTRRRSQLLDNLRSQLMKCGINLFVIDNIENPFVYDQERTKILNRAKITLNLLPTWYDPAFIFRFHLAAGNRSLVVSEIIQPHCPMHIPGEHYISVRVDDLANTINYYLNHPDKRRKITENAYNLVSTQMTLGSSVESLVNIINNRL